MARLSIFIFIFCALHALASDRYPINEAINVQHYLFQIELNDSTDVIRGKAVITLLFKKAISEFELDLVNREATGGMEVKDVLLQGKSIGFSHKNDRLRISLPALPKPGRELLFEIYYSGIPRDGLIISKNKFGDRTFFGDNWPDRAHHWLPSVDHPSDKATCEFVIIAPDHYQVVANGKKRRESNLGKNQKLTHWEETVEIPMKVMVIGVARFAIQEAGRVDAIPVESWVYPQNRDAGFSDYFCAVKILDFFHRHIGPYPYEKLANVQSTTRFGGMENASNIFYTETSVTGKNGDEALVAHEIAHQWFGNSATEKDWHHVWLSEGFATYFSHLYLESVYGHDRLVKEMTADRIQVLQYAERNPGPVIDTLTTDLMKLLNPYSYQKGAWVLHMLRHQIGDSIFWNGIRNYYRVYGNGNALSKDFIKIIEETSGQNLAGFFNQWIRQVGHPVISGYWKYEPQTKSVFVSLVQNQPGPSFAITLDVGIQSQDGTRVSRSVKVDRKSQEYSLPVEDKPAQLVLDPESWLLFEGRLEAR